MGDNIFYGKNIEDLLKNCINNIENNNCTIIGYEVTDPERFGVVEFDINNSVKGVEEKPKDPKSNFAVTGLYFYTNDVVKFAKSLSPSSRGELEITDLNNIFIKEKKMLIEVMDASRFKWLDSGTFSALLESSAFIKEQQENLNIQVGLLDEVAFLKGFISKSELKDNLNELSIDLQKYLIEKYLKS